MESQVDPDTAHPAATHAGPLRSLRNATFRWLWASGLLIGFGNWMQRLTIGWLVLDQTGSVFLTALSFAIRSAPNLVFGPIGGAVADRFTRRKVLMVTAGLKAAVAIGLWLLALQADVFIWGVMGLVAVAGITAAFEMPATQALAFDVVGRKNAANGVAMLSVATRAVGAIGAVTGGFLIEALGAGPVFFLGAIAFVVGGVAVSRVVVDQPSPAFERAGLGLRGLSGEMIGGVKLLLGIPVVATLLAFATAVEILGFTYQSVMPSLAEDVLDVGPAGLGALTAMAGVGGLIGSLLITALSDYERKGLLAVGVIFVYGTALVALGASDLFPLSLFIVTSVGVMASSFDALQWTLLMANVPDDMRGRAMGGWIFAIGFGWVGSIELGIVAELVSVGWALAVNGIGLLILGLIALFFASGLRRA